MAPQNQPDRYMMARKARKARKGSPNMGSFQPGMRLQEWIGLISLGISFEGSRPQMATTFLPEQAFLRPCLGAVDETFIKHWLSFACSKHLEKVSRWKGVFFCCFKPRINAQLLQGCDFKELFLPEIPLLLPLIQ